MFRLAGLFLVLVLAAPSAEIRGSALVDDALWTWGDRLERWQLPSLKRATIGRFTTRDGGCVYDLDGDGRRDVIAPAPQGLVWFRAPRWTPVVLDRDVEMTDCAGAELHGRRGVFVVHLGAQVRFYESTGAYREIYSFYTASYQAGLLLHDVDGDGREDIFSGNYWMQAPAAFELPWRLFAINTWSEQPKSASARLAFDGAALLWAESRMSPGRVAWFARPSPDPRVLWSPVMATAEFAYPQGVAVLDGAAYVGENNGAASRLMRVERDGRVTLISKGEPIRQLLPWRDALIVMGADRVRLYRPPRK